MLRHSRHMRHRRYIRHGRLPTPPAPPVRDPIVTKQRDITGAALNDEVAVITLFSFDYDSSVSFDDSFGFTADNSAIVEVGMNGLAVTIKAAGVTTVTATAKQGSSTASATITTA